MAEERRSILVASGLDPSGGAGFIADVRVVERAGWRAAGAITAQTVQDTCGVRRVEPVGAELLEAQLTALLSDVEVAAVKIGLVADGGGAEALARALALTGAPIVWDPVGAASSGAALALEDLASLAARLAPEVDLITPNLAEAGAILGRRVSDLEAARVAAVDLAARFGCAVLVTGGHLEGAPTDVLAADGSATDIAGRRVAGAAVHGTGCFLSSAIACGLAAGLDAGAAARRAKAELEARLDDPAHPGRGAPAVL